MHDEQLEFHASPRAQTNNSYLSVEKAAPRASALDARHETLPVLPVVSVDSQQSEPLAPLQRTKAVEIHKATETLAQSQTMAGLRIAYRAMGQTVSAERFNQVQA